MKTSDVKTSIQIDQELWKRAKVEAAMRGMGSGVLVHAALQQYLNLEPEPETKQQISKRQKRLRAAVDELFKTDGIDTSDLIAAIENLCRSRRKKEEELNALFRLRARANE